MVKSKTNVKYMEEKAARLEGTFFDTEVTAFVV